MPLPFYFLPFLAKLSTSTHSSTTARIQVLSVGRRGKERYTHYPGGESVGSISHLLIDLGRLHSLKIQEYRDYILAIQVRLDSDILNLIEIEWQK